MIPEKLEVGIRDTARELKGLYEALEQRKHSPEKPPEVRTMQNTGGKPSMPGNWLWMSRGIESEQQIRLWAFAAFRDLQITLKDDEGKIHLLLEKVALNAFYIAEWDQAADFHEILDGQARAMSSWLYPPDTAEDPDPDRFLTMGSLQRTLKSREYEVPEGTIRYWAHEGHVRTRKHLVGKTGYSLRDVIKKLA